MIRFSNKWNGSTVVWEMYADDEGQYRREWALRHTTGQTEGNYVFRCRSIDGKPYAGNLRGLHYTVTFGESVENPAAIGEAEER